MVDARRPEPDLRHLKAVAFRAKLWNIGGEAQLYIGAVMTVVLGTGLLPWPSVILIPLLMIASALGGALTLLSIGPGN